MRHVQDTVSTPDGSCPVSLFVPDTCEPVPGVVMYPDVGGFRPTFQEMAATLAGFGYAVLLPDMYYRHRATPHSRCRRHSPIQASGHG